MFLECCNHVNLEFDDLDKKFCYSFVIHHPENKIVLPIKDMALYLIECYEINYRDELFGVKYVIFSTPNIFFNFLCNSIVCDPFIINIFPGSNFTFCSRVQVASTCVIHSIKRYRVNMDSSPRLFHNI